MKSPVIALLSERTPEQLPQGWLHATSQSSLFSEPPADVVLLDLPRARCEALLPILRSSPAYRFALIYTRQREDDGAMALSDGPIPGDPERILPAWRLLSERLAMFNQGRPPERFEERVLAWLWTRPHQSLQPRRDTSAPQMYRYPVLSAMAGDEQVNDMVWLRLMTEQGWLQPGNLVDRIRLCVNCHSARLNYVDVCPSCNALDIARQPSLHCFTCGHVAPQEHFLKDGLMMCPNCLTRLRHIGADYDRPLENYRCQSCQNFFVDADVEARCLDCDRDHQPDELRIRELRDYQLTENGRLRCRQGFAEGSHSDHFGRLNLIGLEAFRTMLDWQVQQGRRYRDTPRGSLLALRFENLNELLANTGGQATVDNLVERIQEAVRDTDRCTRSREDTLWFLLPHTDREGMTILWRRLQELARLAQTADGTSLNTRVAGFTLPDDLLAQEDAQLLMARLLGEVT